jgi:hypothetical protein
MVDAQRITAFVRSGGGVILSGGALRTPGLGGLAAGSPGTHVDAPQPFDTSATEPRRGLGLIPLSPRSDAVVLERRGNLIAVAARRIERGRAVSSGYLDTWRWRMGGDETALREHRDWWADLVASVAYSGRIVRPARGVTDEAPRATLIARLGPASSAPASPGGTDPVPRSVLFAILATSLLVEWASRRLRGVR